MAFSEEYKEELVEDIVNETMYSGNNFDYEDFAADCVREVVSKWSDRDLAGWFGRETGTDCPIADSIDCYSGDCEHDD